MTAPSLLLAARMAPDRRERILAMAGVMREMRFGAEDGCTIEHLRMKGFTDAEIEVYGPPAIAVLGGRPSPLRTTPNGRIAALAMVRRIGRGVAA